MPGIFPEVTNGAVVIRDTDGNCLPIPGAQPPYAYCPPETFTTSCSLTALSGDCTSRVAPSQINAIVSELLCLTQTLSPTGNWDCESTCNLSEAFQQWVAAGGDNGGDVNGPTSAELGNIAIFGNVNGKEIVDSGISIDDVVLRTDLESDGFVRSASMPAQDGHVVLYSGTTGAVIKTSSRAIGGSNGLAVLDVDGYIPETEMRTASYPDESITVPKLAAEVVNRLIEFDIRDPMFAGGAPWNGIDDDSPAFAAAIAYFKTLGGLDQYHGANAARLRLPRGQGRLSSTGVNLSGAHNVHLIGEGDGVTTVNLAGNFPAFYTTTVAGNDDFRIGLADFCIFGPGRGNVNAHGVDFGALNNGFIRDVRFFALRDAIRLRNNWQTDLTRIKIDGGPTVGGSHTCYRGICLLDGLAAGGGSNSVIENAVKIQGGIISACETVGFRGESVSGSIVMGLEILACGQTGMHIGDNPGGKDVKWFSVIGCLIDTCGDLLVLQKGNSNVLEDMHFSGMWLGYANAGSGNGDAVRIEDAAKITIRPDIVANCDVALVTVRCSEIVFEAGVIDGYDRSLVGATGIILENTQTSTISVGRARRWPGSPSTRVLAETGTSDFNVIDKMNADNTMTIIGAGTIVNAARPFKARNKGSASIASGASSVVVNHGLGRTPLAGEIQVTPIHQLSGAGVASFAVDPALFTATTFTITTNVATTAGIGFAWLGDVSRG